MLEAHDDTCYDLHDDKWVDSLHDTCHSKEKRCVTLLIMICGTLARRHLAARCDANTLAMSRMF